ncbi:hypothetical protein J4226_01180 [Candidatus Pacearchaeota archaeon]|nr:hypothetical protein [Candidatus Pacearchaeota archaeon]
MDYKVLLVYFLIAVVILSLFFLVILFSSLVLHIFKRDPEDTYIYLKNIVYGAAGGLIATIFLDVKNEATFPTFIFWSTKILSTFVLVLIFILLGFAYLYILKKVYRWIKINSIKTIKPKMVKQKNNEKNTLEDFFEKNNYTLIVLSIFLLVTISLVEGEGNLNNVLALLSSLITYFVLIGINRDNNDKGDTFPLWGFEIVFPLFISAFCAWVVLNVVITLTGNLAIITWGLIWFGLMIYPGAKFWKRR